jgi:hypothetical protein
MRRSGEALTSPERSLVEVATIGRDLPRTMRLSGHHDLLSDGDAERLGRTAQVATG